MSKEAREAAERIVNAQRFWTGTVPFGPGYLDIDERDVMRVARACLAEHPADDDEPVTAEWLESIGFYRDGTHPDDPFTCRESALYLSPKYDDETTWVVFVEVYEIGNIKTRGDVRRLLTALGIEVPK